MPPDLHGLLQRAATAPRRDPDVTAIRDAVHRRRRTRTAVGSAGVGLAVVTIVASSIVLLGPGAETGDRPAPPAAPASTAEAAPTSVPSVPSVPSIAPVPPVLPSSAPAEVATTADIALAAAFVDFAKQPTPERARAVRFADFVALGLGDEVVVDIPREEVSDRAAWVLDVEMFAAYNGPFSALDVLADDDLDPAGADPVLVGSDYDHCAGPPRPGPSFDAATSNRMLVLQPGPGRTDSCLEWYAVEVHLDADHRVSAVVLDAWEP